MFQTILMKQGHRPWIIVVVKSFKRTKTPSEFDYKMFMLYVVFSLWFLVFLPCPG